MRLVRFSFAGKGQDVWINPKSIRSVEARGMGRENTMLFFHGLPNSEGVTVAGPPMQTLEALLGERTEG
jgi:hypothetical protein